MLLCPLHPAASISCSELAPQLQGPRLILVLSKVSAVPAHCLSPDLRCPSDTRFLDSVKGQAVLCSSRGEIWPVRPQVICFQVTALTSPADRAPHSSVATRALALTLPLPGDLLPEAPSSSALCSDVSHHGGGPSLLSWGPSTLCPQQCHSRVPFPRCFPLFFSQSVYQC